MAEYDDPEGIIEEQLEQQNQSLRELKNSIDSFRVETSRHFDENLRKMDLIMDMLRELRDYIRTPTSPTDHGSELSTMNLQPDDTIGDAVTCDEQQIEVQPNGVNGVQVEVQPIEVLGWSADRSQSNVQQAKTSISAISSADIVKEQVRTQSMKLPFVDLKSILSSRYEVTMNGSVNVSTKAWFEGVASIMEAVLSKNVMEDDAHKVFDKMSKLTSMKQNFKIDGFEEMVLSIVRLPRVLSCGSEVTDELLMFIFDPGGYSSLHKGRNPFEFKHCFMLFQILYMFHKLPESHTLRYYASKPQSNCQSPSYHSKRNLRYVFNWYAASENHNGEKFDYRSSYTSSLMETSVEVVGLNVNDTADTNSIGSWEDSADGCSQPSIDTDLEVATRKETSLVTGSVNSLMVRMSWADMAQEDELEAEENNAAGDTFSKEIKPKSQLSGEQTELIRFNNVQRKKDFICFERPQWVVF